MNLNADGEFCISQKRAGYQKPLTADGISIANTLLGKPQVSDHEYLYWEFHEAGGKIAIRMGDWKVVWTHLLDSEIQSKCVLYNLKTDPSESTDVASAHPEIIQKTISIYRQQHQKSEIEKFQISIAE